MSLNHNIVKGKGKKRFCRSEFIACKERKTRKLIWVNMINKPKSLKILSYLNYWMYSNPTNM